MIVQVSTIIDTASKILPPVERRIKPWVWLYYGEMVQSVSKLFLSSAAFSATLCTITFLNVSYEVHAY